MQHSIKIFLPKSFLFLISIFIISKNVLKERIKSKILYNISNYSVKNVVANFKLYILAILLLFILVTIIIISDIDMAFAKKDDSKRKTIDVCCSWGNSISDGVLTFSIKNGGSELAKIVKVAINQWEKALKGSVQFKYVKGDSVADIEIEFKKGKGEKVGKTVTFFDHLGYIDHVEISISKKSYGRTLDQSLLEHVAKHEFGHALGLGHANFKESIMAPTVQELITKISACELDSVKFVNNLKLTDDDKAFNTLDIDTFKCKKK